MNLGVFVPSPANQIIYRPVGGLLTWQLGWLLWGANPLPYHLAGLLLHAACAGLLAGWLVAATGRAGLGALAGTLFAVFPTHLEAVGWVAAQWDEWAAAFALLSVLLFTVWWRRGHGPGFYWGAVAAYALAVFSKESVLALAPIVLVITWAVPPGRPVPGWPRRLGLFAPWAAILAGNVGLRLATWGTIGGYPGTGLDLSRIAGDGLARWMRVFLAPLSPPLFDPRVVQVVGLASLLGLVTGLIWFGRPARRLLALAGCWVLLALLPVLNLANDADALSNNRFLYLAAIGYCTGAAVLLAALVRAAGRRRRLVTGAIGLLLVLSAAVCWVQLQPWLVATAQADALVPEMTALLPPMAHPRGLIWYLENAADTYQEVPVFALGLNDARTFATGERLWPRKTAHAETAPLTARPEDAFALRFAYSAADTRWHVAYAAGVTQAVAPGTLGLGSRGALWDFRACGAAALAAWQPHHAQATCAPGSGLHLQPTGADPQWESAAALPPAPPGARFARLTVAARYPPLPAPPTPALALQWFRRAPDGGWGTPNNETLPLASDGAAHVYWAFLPLESGAPALGGLRFDPVAGLTPVDLAWIALDYVP